MTVDLTEREEQFLSKVGGGSAEAGLRSLLKREMALTNEDLVPGQTPCERDYLKAVRAMRETPDCPLLFNDRSSREKAHVFCRFIISDYLRSRGYTYYAIGAASGFHHSTIVYHIQQMDKIYDFPSQYPEAIWRKREFDKNILKDG